MGLSLRPLGKKIWETLTPQNEDALRAGQRSIADANQRLQQTPPRYGVLAQPARQQQFTQQEQRPPEFNVGRQALGAFADTLTQPERLAEAPKVDVGTFKGSGLIEDFVNSPFKQAEGAVNIGQGNFKKGVGQAVTGSLEGPLGLLPVGRTAEAGFKGAGLLPKVVAGAKAGLIEGAVTGGAYGAGQAAENELGAGDIIKSGVVGGAIGGAGGALMGGATPLVTAGAKQLPKVAAKGAELVDNRVPLHENTAGAVGRDVPQPLPKVTAKKTRGFQENMARTNEVEGNLTADAVIEAMPGYKPVANRTTLGKAATEINKDAEAAYARIATKPQLTTAQDVATGHLLLRQAVEGGDIEAAIQIGTKLGIDGTKLGQAVQAYSMWKKTTPEGIVKYASKKAGKVGKELDPAITGELIERAKAIADMPESLEKAKATRELLGKADSVGRDWKDTVAQVLSTPRSAMATADLSAPFRQGAVLGSRFPKEWGKNFGEAIKFFVSPGAYERSMYEISQRPSYALMKARKLAVSGAEQLTGTEEQFMKGLLESDVAKKLGVGHVVAASDRAYSGFLTKMRADVFDKVIADSKDAGVKLDAKALDSLAKFINSASGRGSGKTLDKHAGLLSQALFSPRLWKSRLDVLNPVYYARLDPVARKYALQSAASFAGMATTVLGIAAAAGADVGADPRSADFGKIKIGNTRYDILGGLQQNIRLAAQLATGEKINSETGEVQTLGPDRGFGKPSRLDILYQFVENKENPVVGVATKTLRGTDPTGTPINPATEVGKLGIPLTAQGTYDTAKDQGSLAKGFAMNVPGIFGVGVQTYGSKPGAKPKVMAKGESSKQAGSLSEQSALESQETKELKANLKPGGYSLQQLSGGKYAAQVGDDVKTFDTLPKAREAIAKDAFKGSDAKSKVIGDTYFYKNRDGDVKSKPKVLHDWEQKDAKNKLELDRAYESSDLNKWLKLADEQVKNLESKKSLYDPETEQDEIDKITLQQENLSQKAEKYIAKGSIGGSGGKKKGTVSAGSAYKYAVSAPSGGQSVRPTITVRSSGGVRSTKARGVARPRVTLKKSRA